MAQKKYKMFNKWKKDKMNVIFICTSNKDRSPALEKYFNKVYPQHNYSSAGINKYFCRKKNTTYLTLDMLENSDIIVFAEKVHHDIALRDFGRFWHDNRELKYILELNLGDYEQGNINDEYLLKADNKIGWSLK